MKAKKRVVWCLGSRWEWGLFWNDSCFARGGGAVDSGGSQLWNFRKITVFEVKLRQKRIICDICVNGLKWDETNEKLLFSTLYCLFQHLYRILHSKCINLHRQWMKLRRKCVLEIGFGLSTTESKNPKNYVNMYQPWWAFSWVPNSLVLPNHLWSSSHGSRGSRFQGLGPVAITLPSES